MAKKFSPLIAYGPALAKFREKANLTQEQLAEELGVSRGTLTGWEGQVEVKFNEDQIKTISKVLGLDDPNVLTNVPHGTDPGYILDHPLIKQMVDQSKYIMRRVETLEEENRRLRGDKDN